MEINSVDCPKCGGNIPEQISKGKLFKCNNCGSTLVWPDNQSKLLLSFGIRICPNCGVDNEQTRNYCRNCGAALTKICSICKSSFYIGDTFCPNGHNYEPESEQLEKEVQKRKAETILAQANAAYEDGDNLKTVLTICELALSIAPDLGEAHFLKGTVLEDLRKLDDAIIAYNNALKFDPALKSDVDSAIHKVEALRKKWTVRY